MEVGVGVGGGGGGGILTIFFSNFSSKKLSKALLLLDNV